MRPMRRFHALLCLTGLVGCDPIDEEDTLAVDEVVGDDESLPEGPDRLGAGAKDPDAAYVSSYTWLVGDPILDMGPVNDRVCFLRGYQGRLEPWAVHSSQGVVDIYNNRWRVYGGHDATSVDAVCVPLDWYGQSLWYSIEHSVDAFTNSLKDLGPSAGKVCFLTVVSGRFEGGGEAVQVYMSNGRWNLSAQSQQSRSNPQNNVLGGARCIHNSAWISGPYHWQQGQASVTMASISDWICGLTRLTGKFEGGGEGVKVWASGGSWTLGGTSQQAGVAASAHCL